MELEEALKKITELEAQVKEKDTQVSTLTGQVTNLTDSIKDKDRVIQEKSQQIVGIRQENQRIKAFTEEEKATKSQEEIAEREEKIKLQEQLDLQSKQISEFQTKELNGRKEAIIAKLAKGDKNLADRIELNFGRIKDSDTAQTEAEMTAIATEAYYMSNPTQAIPNPLNVVIGDQGGGDGQDTIKDDGEGFADSPEGKALAESMNLN